MKMLASLASMLMLAHNPFVAGPVGLRDVSRVLFSFDTLSEADWRILNDGVMGGRSQGYGMIENGVLRFFGTTVTQGGGFTSVRTPVDLNLDGYDGIELLVRGGGRSFQVEVSDDTSWRGRRVSRRAAFETGKDWTRVRIPFAELRSSIFGRSVDAGNLNTAAITGMGIYIADGQDGEFTIEIESISAYSSGR